MNKKLIMITTLVLVMVMAAAGSALAGNGNGEATGEPVNEPIEEGLGNRHGSSDEKGTGQRFAGMAGDYETEEEFHAAVLAQKLEIIAAKVADESLSQEDADAIITHLTSCDGDCEVEGANPNRPEDGFGIFGSGTKTQGGNGGNAREDRPSGERQMDCDEEEPLQDGSGSQSENGNGYKGGNGSN